jgi:hypothetical protein
MIWLSWRQFRVSALAVLVAVAAAAIALAVTGPQLADLLTTEGDDFFNRLSLEDGKIALFSLGIGLAYAVPAVIGVFWGAPMVARELEAGTHRLVWNQSITRTRWLTTKLAVTALGAALAGLIGLAMTWWSMPLDDAVARGLTDGGPLSMPRIWPQLFGARGVVPLCLTLLALAVGVAWGMFVRRTVAAMALTLVTVVAVQILMPVLVQPHLLTPETLTAEITNQNLRGLSMSGGPGAPDPQIGHVEIAIDRPGSWITSNVTLGPDGEVVEFLPAWAEACAPGPGKEDRGTSDACFARLADAGYRQEVKYLPASRYWALQGVEGAILLGLAAGAVGLCFWRIRRDF